MDRCRKLRFPQCARRRCRTALPALSVAILWLGALTCIGWAVDARADPYRLGVQDKVRIKVIDWRAAKGEYQEWDALADDYAVNPSGAVSLPLIGEIPAEGRTSDELARAITEAIQQRSGVLNRPGASVEVIK